MTKPAIALVAFAQLVVACGTATDGEARSRCTPVADDVDVITVAPPWEVGRQRTYEIVATTDYGGGLEVGLPDPTFANLRVDAPTEDGLAMVWTAVPQQVGLVTWQFGLDPPLPAAARYEWSEAVERPEVANPFELGLWLGRVIDTSRLAVATEQRVSFDENVAQLEALTESQMNVLFLRNAALLHLLEGSTIPIGDASAFDSSLMSAVSDEPIRAPGTVEVVDTTDDRGCVALRIIRSPDPAVLNQALRSSGASVGTVTLEQTIDVQYDAVSGFVESVTVAETFSIPGAAPTTDTVQILDLTGELDD